MANIVTLHKRQLFLAAGTVARYARVSFRVNHTTTQLSVFSDPSCDPEFERSQPVICDVYGVLPVCYMVAVTAFRILATDENDVPLPGYGEGGMDDITPEPTDTSGADTISFNPSALVPETTVQAAIEYVADQIPSTEDAGVIVWPTGGTGNAYTLTPTPAIIDYAVGVSYWIRPDRSNTGAVTINISGLGTRSLQKTGTDGNPVALAANELSAHTETYISYDGSVFRILSSRVSGASGSGVNGSWNLNSGWLTCVSQLKLTYQTTGNVSGIWTYPRAFTSIPTLVGGTVIGGELPSASGADAALPAPGMATSYLKAPIIGPRSTTSLTARVFHDSGLNFTAEDEIWIVVFAMGPGV